MKRLLSLIFGLSLVIPFGCSTADKKDLPDFKTATKLNQLEEAIKNGNRVVSAYYTKGYGFSTSEFTTTDPEEIEELIESLNPIEIESRTNQSVTDWYPVLTFTLENGKTYSIRFEGEWLVLDRKHYNLVGTEDFYEITNKLLSKYSKD